MRNPGRAEIVGHDEVMGKIYEQLTDRLRAFIDEQPVFFVATAPLAGDGHVNLSPKGRQGTLAVLSPLRVAYLDYGGSHAETLAHLRENGRITLMWCAFTGPPKVLRVHGHGEPIWRDDPRLPELLGHFADPVLDGLRCAVLIEVDQVSDSCGYAVPLLEHVGERPLHTDFFGRKSDDEFADYCAAKPFNAHSIDGLSALPLPLPPLPASST